MQALGNKKLEPKVNKGNLRLYCTIAYIDGLFFISVRILKKSTSMEISGYLESESRDDDGLLLVSFLTSALASPLRDGTFSKVFISS